jgi:hypothetical protein
LMQSPALVSRSGASAVTFLSFKLPVFITTMVKLTVWPVMHRQQRVRQHTTSGDCADKMWQRSLHALLAGVLASPSKPPQHN